MRVVIVLCTLLVVGTFKPELWTWDYQPPAGFTVTLMIAWLVALILDIIDAVVKFGELRSLKAIQSSDSERAS